MTGGDPSEFMDVMERRGDLLSVLAEGPLEKYQLDDRLDVSRSTIDRGVRTLEDMSLVERTDGGYRRTLTGRLALEEYEHFERRIRGLCEGTDVVSLLAEDADLDGALLEGARIVRATRESPQRPVEILYGVVGRATSIRGFAPAVHSQQVETYRRRLLEAEMSAELVVTEAAIERLVSEFPDAFDEAMGIEDVTFWETDAELTYSLTLARTPSGTHVGVVVYDDEGIRGGILNDAPAAVEWAERRFEDVRAEASRVT